MTFVWVMFTLIVRYLYFVYKLKDLPLNVIINTNVLLQTHYKLETSKGTYF